MVRAHLQFTVLNWASPRFISAVQSWYVQVQKFDHLHRAKMNVDITKILLWLIISNKILVAGKSEKGAGTPYLIALK